MVPRHPGSSNAGSAHPTNKGVNITPAAAGHRARSRSVNRANVVARAEGGGVSASACVGAGVGAGAASVANRASGCRGAFGCGGDGRSATLTTSKLSSVGALSSAILGVPAGVARRTARAVGRTIGGRTAVEPPLLCSCSRSESAHGAVVVSTGPSVARGGPSVGSEPCVVDGLATERERSARCRGARDPCERPGGVEQ